MTSIAVSRRPFLICHSAARHCGFPLQHVVEIMRAQPTQPFPDMASFVSGLALIRGAMIPVVNLAILLGQRPEDASSRVATRYVTLRLEQHQLAFAVDEVLGVQQLEADSIESFPALLGDAEQGIVAAIGTLDSSLLLILEAARAIPAGFWDADFLRECAA